MSLINGCVHKHMPLPTDVCTLSLLFHRLIASIIWVAAIYNEWFSHCGDIPPVKVTHSALEKYNTPSSTFTLLHRFPVEQICSSVHVSLCFDFSSPVWWMCFCISASEANIQNLVWVSAYWTNNHQRCFRVTLFPGTMSLPVELVESH